MALTAQQKSALEITAAVVAGVAVLWWISKGSATAPSGDVTGGSLPVYGGSADPGSVAGTLGEVAPLNTWPTFPAFPPVTGDGGNAIYPADPLAGLIPSLLRAFNGGQSGCCCGTGLTGGNPITALVSATPPPYQAPTQSDQVAYPPSPAVQPWYAQFNSGPPTRYGGPGGFGGWDTAYTFAGSFG